MPIGIRLTEMVTGQRAFEGKSQLRVASAILERDPTPISAARHGIPPALERTIAICLAKDPEQRWSTADDVVSQLTSIANSEVDPTKLAAGRLPGSGNQPQSIAADSTRARIFVDVYDTNTGSWSLYVIEDLSTVRTCLSRGGCDY